MRKFFVCLFCLLASVALCQTNPPLLLRKPALSKTQIVFNYGGNLWIVSRDGGEARRLTSGVGTENNAAFSPTATGLRSLASTTAIQTST